MHLLDLLFLKCPSWNFGLVRKLVVIMERKFYGQVSSGNPTLIRKFLNCKNSQSLYIPRGPDKGTLE